MQRKIIIVFFTAMFFVCFAPKAFSQEIIQTPLDTLTSAVYKLQTETELQKRFKITGYVQAQYQSIDSVGAASFAGGNFPANTDNRFVLRRGRIKAAYDNGIAQGVIQFDATEKGLALKDAYVKITEPWLNAVSLTSGVFDRAFGFEISYSSSMRESPERSRLFQTIFPGERDLGAKVGFQMPKTSNWNFLKIEGGFYNGTGGTASDFDSKKDFIGNIGINKTTKNEKINYALRTSYYNGGYRQPTKFIYNNASGIGFAVDSTTENKGKIARREYVGVDFQVNSVFPFGMTTLRGEYIQGTQPGTAATTSSPAADPAADTYLRNFNGAYVYLLQNIGQSKHQLVLKYDWYDPNTKAAGNDIGKAGSKLTKSDLKYTTLGIGWVFRVDANVKFTAYYDMVTSETSSNVVGFTKDLKDNALTLRVQYKF